MPDTVCCVRKSLLWPIIPYLDVDLTDYGGWSRIKSEYLRDLYISIISSFMLAKYTHGVEEVWCLLDIRMVEGLSCVYVNHLPSQITVKVYPSKVEMQCLWCYWCAKSHAAGNRRTSLLLFPNHLCCCCQRNHRQAAKIFVCIFFLIYVAFPSFFFFSFSRLTFFYHLFSHPPFKA